MESSSAASGGLVVATCVALLPDWHTMAMQSGAQINSLFVANGSSNNKGWGAGIMKEQQEGDVEQQQDTMEQCDHSLPPNERQGNSNSDQKEDQPPTPDKRKTDNLQMMPLQVNC
jgi:hypothetical protein